MALLYYILTNLIRNNLRVAYYAILCAALFIISRLLTRYSNRLHRLLYGMQLTLFNVTPAPAFLSLAHGLLLMLPIYININKPCHLLIACRHL